MRKFTIVWAGYLVSVMGSTLTSVALGVWVFERTRSATAFGLIILMSFLPGILVAPLAGAIVDRWNRRSVLMTCNGIGAVVLLGLAGLHALGALAIWTILVGVGIQSILQAVLAPAMNSTVILLVQPSEVGRANGMLLLAQALGGTLGFAAGGVLYLTLGLGNVLLLDSCSFAVNLIAVASVAIPAVADLGSVDVADGSTGSLLQQTRHGWRYLTMRKDLLAVVVLYGTVGLFVAPADVLITPVVLSFAGAQTLGFVLAGAGTGAVIGSLMLAAWRGPARRVHALAGLTIPIGICMCVGVARPDALFIMAAAFGYSLFSSYVDGTARGILQVEVTPAMQGRVFALFNMVASTAQCISFAAAGPLADHVFEPLLRDGGALTGTVGEVMGTGPGRGTAFLVFFCGLAVVVTALRAYASPALRALPDRPTGGTRDPTGDHVTSIEQSSDDAADDRTRLGKSQ